MFDRERRLALLVKMASFDFGFDVTEFREISSEDVDILIF